MVLLEEERSIQFHIMFTIKYGNSHPAGYAAGSVGSFISNPANNIVASINNKKADSLMPAIRNIRVANLFTRSVPIRIILIGPVVTLQWSFYDTIKILSGLPTSGEVSTDASRENIKA